MMNMLEAGLIHVTAVIPVYRGEEYLSKLMVQLEKIRDKWEIGGCPLELTEAIFVNDAAIDGSLDILYEIQKDRPWVKVINLSRNYGQHQATVAGILHSSGDWIVTLDEDLQHDPLLIECLLKKAVLNEQDVIYAKPETAVHESIMRDQSSKLFKKVVGFLSGNQHVSKFNSYRLIRGSIARASASVCSHGAYYDMVLCWFTNRLMSVDLPMVDIRYTKTGKSGYTLRALLTHARKMLINSEAKIIRIGAVIGSLTLFLVLIIGLNVLFSKLVTPDAIPIAGWTSLFLSLLFFGGLVTILLGVVLEYISVILLHIQGKPAFYVVDRRIDRVLRDYYNM